MPKILISKKVKILLGVIVFLSLFFVGTESVSAATLYWVGSDGANASVASNWSTTNPTSCVGNVTPSGAIPGTSDQMNFDADCDNSSVIDSGFSATVSQVVLSAGYSGTVTLNRSLTISSTSSFTAGTFVCSSSGTLTTTGTVTVDGGTLTLTSCATTDMNGALTISSGTFTAPSGTMSLGSHLTISGGTFNHNSGTVNFDGGLSTLSCNNATFNLVTFNNTSTKTVNADCNFPLGNNPILAGIGAISLLGTFTGTGTITQNANQIFFQSGATLTGFSGLITNQITVSGGTMDFSGYSTFTTNNLILSSGSISLPSGSDLNGSLTISGGTFTAPSGNMNLAGNFIHTSGNFNANGGTVVLDGSSQTLSGIDTVFYNLTKIASGTSRTLTIAAGVKETTTGTLTLRGESGAVLSLRSSSTGTQWRLDPQGGRSISNVNVQDSWNMNSSPILAGGTNSIDSGNNTNWDFNTYTLSFFLDYPPGESHITNPVPTFRWKKATTGSGTSVTKYELWIEDPDSNHDYYADNIQPSYETNKTFEYLTYSIKDDGDYLNLTPIGYGLNGGKNNWRVKAHDTAGNTREESVDFYLDDNSQTTIATNPIARMFIPKQQENDEKNEAIKTPQTPLDEKVEEMLEEIKETRERSGFRWWMVLIPFIFFFLFLIWKRRKKKKEEKE